MNDFNNNNETPVKPYYDVEEWVDVALDMDDDDDFEYEKLNEMTPTELFVKRLEYEGLLGSLPYKILDLVRKIYGIDLTELYPAER